MGGSDVGECKWGVKEKENKVLKRNKRECDRGNEMKVWRKKENVWELWES